ncbi:hypothetical protein C8A03DRAFT_38158 [Achaetomium macrosporum]|uniref:Uncharacterized protein n=1 Tax=Achaetomium macrosporum TaxID=79813 RepID=A0AAN7C2C2_9PEZI|nr:hypothetical protein C8A03DRAFT_38158 [Achaetomium macrosporum]
MLALLVAYGRLTERALCEDIIAKTIMPLSTAPAPIPNKTLSVRHHGAIMWSIPVQECQTWFVRRYKTFAIRSTVALNIVIQTFVSHFRNYQPRRLQFFYGAMAVKPKNWPKFYRLAVRLDRKLVFDLHLKPPLTLPQSEVLVPLSTTAVDKTAEADRQPPASAGLTLGLRSENPGSLAPSSKEDRIRLTSPSPLIQGKDWRTSEPEMESSCGVFAYLDCFAKLGMSSTTLPAQSPSFKDVTVKKYFSDLEDHIWNKTIIGDRRLYRSIEEVERSAVHAVIDSERQSLDLGEPSAEHQRDFDKRVNLFNSADAVFKFFFPPDTWVATTGRYWGAVLALIKESYITTGHPDRRIDQKLNLFRQELSIIDWTVDIQISILQGPLRTRDSVAQNVGAQFVEAEEMTRNKSKRDLEPLRYQPYTDPPRHDTIASMAEGVFERNELGELEPCGLSYILLHECLKNLFLKKAELKVMRDTAIMLRKTNETNLNRTKDRQERAIYAFTIVTVIFLPLSAVASVFGMNTADIRDMDLGQWAYWATAMPVTIVVVPLGLLFTGELANVKRWVGERIERWRESRRRESRHFAG